MLWVFCVIVFAQFALAEEKGKKDYPKEPWERAALYLGAFFIDADTDLKLGSGDVDVNVDGEQVLGLDDTKTAFRGDLFWRITRRNRVDFTYYALHRDGSDALTVDIPDPGGGPGFTVGQSVDTKFNVDILRGSYAWSFFKDERFDLGVAGGLYGIAVDFKIETEGTAGGAREKTDFAFPLPVIGLRGSFALTPTVFIRQHFDFFYVNIDDYEGTLVDFMAAVEWNAFKYVGIGVGYNYVAMNLEYSGSDDFLSEFDFRYGGVLAFAKLYF